MNKKGIIIGNFIFAFCLTFGVALTFTLSNHPKNTVETDVFKEVDEELNKLSIEEKIGQMLIISVPGENMNEILNENLTNNQVGGVILFSDNISTYDNTVKFIEDIKSTTNIPMFIAIDQEGGKVQRLLDCTDLNVTNIPPMVNLGKTNNPSLAYDTGKVMAEELNAFHINMDFAPVLDIVKDSKAEFIGPRSLGADATLVSHMGNALAQGLLDNNVIPVFKHFPGHGSTITDSHYELPLINKTKEELLKSDLIPFQNAIDAGAEVIMVGHLAIPSITSNNTPASLSKEVITDLLYNELGFQGIVITDALNMKAITNYYTEQEIYEMAINAGVNLLLMPNNATNAINLIKDSLNKGTISLEQINNSVKKILTLKHQMLKNEFLTKEVIGSTYHQEVINDINSYQ